MFPCNRLEDGASTNIAVQQQGHGSRVMARALRQLLMQLLLFACVLPCRAVFGVQEGLAVPLSDFADGGASTACPPTSKGMWHIMIIWGHGLRYRAEIEKAIDAMDGVQLVSQNEVQLPSLDAAIDEIYRNDIARVGKVRIAAKSKFLFSLPNAKTIRVLVLYDTAPREADRARQAWRAPWPLVPCVRKRA